MASVSPRLPPPPRRASLSPATRLSAAPRQRSNEPVVIEISDSSSPSPGIEAIWNANSRRQSLPPLNVDDFPDYLAEFDEGNNFFSVPNIAAPEFQPTQHPPPNPSRRLPLPLSLRSPPPTSQAERQRRSFSQLFPGEEFISEDDDEDWQDSSESSISPHPRPSMSLLNSSTRIGEPSAHVERMNALRQREAPPTGNLPPIRPTPFVGTSESDISITLPPIAGPQLQPVMQHSRQRQTTSQQTSTVIDLTDSPPLSRRGLNPYDMFSFGRNDSVNSHSDPRGPKRRRADGSGTWVQGENGENGIKSESEEIDLTEVDFEDVETHMKKQAEEKALRLQQEQLLKTQEAEKEGRMKKLKDYQCTICLDDPTDLTATPCGHLYCYVCIVTALRASAKAQHRQPPRTNGVVVGNCPYCRHKINSKDLIPLSIKLGPVKKGKGRASAGPS